VIIRLWLALFLVGILAPLRAQDEPVHMTPEFPLIFPLAQSGENVTVKFPVMINPATVLKPGMVLRTLYVLTLDSQESPSLIDAHKGDADEAYARGPAGGDGGAKMPPELAHELESYRRTVWQVPNNFVLAMAQYPTDEMHLIYERTGKDQVNDMADEHFSFFDGLFVGSPDGKVTVLAVEKESKADLAGIKAGDEIVSVGGFSTQNDLPTFAAAYAAAKKAAKDNEVSSYAMTIRSGGETRQVEIAMPPRIQSGLMDGFDDTPLTPTKPSTPSTP